MQCKSSTKPGIIIAQFYLNKEDVPFPQKFYGDVACFLPLCRRRGAIGFKTDEDMRIHAASRHGMEYQAHLQTTAASTKSETDTMKEQIAQLTAALIARAADPAPIRSAAAERMAKARAAKKNTASQEHQG